MAPMIHWRVSVLLLAAQMASVTIAVAAAPALDVPTKSAFGGIQPRVSSDGSKIALSYHGAICVIPSTGGPLTYLTTGETQDVSPAWSPDAKRIAYVASYRMSAGELRLMDSSDGTPIPISKSVFAQGPLYFHPTENRLFGQFSSDGLITRLCWCDLETGELKPAPLTMKGQQMGPYALSHDGNSIVIATHHDLPYEQEGMNGPQAEVWRAKADGGPAEKLAGFHARIYNLHWDAGDKGVFFVSDAGVSHNDIWYLPLDSANVEPHKITFGQADEDWPSVSNDGRVLIYTDNHAGGTALIRTNPITEASQTLSLDNVNFRAPAGAVRLKLSDQASGEPIVARVAIKQNGGKSYAPIGALYRFSFGRADFSCRGETTFDLPAAHYELNVVRGPEYRDYRREFDVKPGETVVLDVLMERWTDMAARGWYSGDNHIHANYGYGAWYHTPRSVLDRCKHEDLNVANIMVANSDGESVYDREFFLGRPDGTSRQRYILYWNEEFRSTLWGHMTLINLARLVEPLFTGFRATTNPWDIPTNADIARRARVQRSAVSYTHPAVNQTDPYNSAFASKGLPVDVALGQIDTLDVMGMGYDASVPLWYRLLNCGFRLPASAGTDCFLNRIESFPPGWGRCYVKLPSGLTYKGWVAGQCAGRSFVSKGVMLEFSIDGLDPGETLHLDKTRTVNVKASAWSQYPLTKIELLQNGKVVGEGKLSDDRRTATIDQPLQCDTSGWIAVRAIGPTTKYQAASYENIRGIAAHMNPIYVEVKGRRPSANEDAEFFLAWIDRLEKEARARDRIPADWSHVHLQLDEAREVYRKIARDGPNFSDLR